MNKENNLVVSALIMLDINFKIKVYDILDDIFEIILSKNNNLETEVIEDFYNKIASIDEYLNDNLNEKEYFSAVSKLLSHRVKFINRIKNKM